MDQGCLGLVLMVCEARPSVVRASSLKKRSFAHETLTTEGLNPA